MKTKPKIYIIATAVILFVLPVLILRAQKTEQAQRLEREKIVETKPGRITMDFKEADIKDVLRIISYKSGMNIVSGEDVKGAVTIHLVDVPWQNALDVILRTYGFGYEKEGNIIRVRDLSKLGKEGLQTKVFSLSYARAKEASKSLEKMLSERGKIEFDTRTNLLIVTDIPANLSKLKEVIKILDKITPQAMIEAKIIEITLGDSEKLGIDWTMKIAAGGSKRPTTFPFTSEVKGTGTKMFPKVKVPSQLEVVDTSEYSETGQLITESKEEKMWHKLMPGFPSVASDKFLFGTLDFSQFRAVLEILNSRADTNIISNLRITTLNNQEAKIFVGQVVPIPKYTYSKESGTQVISGYKDQEIGIKLVVTPNINDQNYITLSINPSIEQIIGSTGPNGERPIYSTRSAETKVMIKDGQTLVIGGLISEKKIKYRKKVPILGDIPLLGLLFSKKEDTLSKTDLLIFITPHIVRDTETANMQYLSKSKIEMKK